MCVVEEIDKQENFLCIYLAGCNSRHIYKVYTTVYMYTYICTWWARYTEGWIQIRSCQSGQLEQPYLMSVFDHQSDTNQG